MKSLVFLLFLLGAFAETFDRGRVHIVDAHHTPTNDALHTSLLFRSNVPLDKKGNFLYDELIASMKQVALAERRIEFPTNPYLIIYNLLKHHDDKAIPEREFFVKHPDLGEQIMWSIYGDEHDPTEMSEAEINHYLTKVPDSKDQLGPLVEAMHENLLSLHNNRSVVVLFHCHHGKDRTGEVSGAYQLYYSLRNMQEIAATNWEIKNAHISYRNQRALVWYCLHLQQERGELFCDYENVNKKVVEQPELIGWDEENVNNGYNIATIVLLSVLVGLMLVALLIFICISILCLCGYIGRKFCCSNESRWTTIFTATQNSAFDEEEQFPIDD